MAKWLLFIALNCICINTIAVTLVEDNSQGIENLNQPVQVDFNHSGMVTSTISAQSTIKIDGTLYNITTQLDGLGELLVVGAKVRFNVEKQASDQMGTITKIWLEE